MTDDPNDELPIVDGDAPDEPPEPDEPQAETGPRNDEVPVD